VVYKTQSVQPCCRHGSRYCRGTVLAKHTLFVGYGLHTMQAASMVGFAHHYCVHGLCEFHVRLWRLRCLGECVSEGFHADHELAHCGWATLLS